MYLFLLNVSFPKVILLTSLLPTQKVGSHP